jgi:hypothetical protein
MATYRWRVDIIESERGWGSKLDDEKFFDTEAEARAFVEDYNAENDLPYVPDWYMAAMPPVCVRVD